MEGIQERLPRERGTIREGEREGTIVRPGFAACRQWTVVIERPRASAERGWAHPIAYAEYGVESAQALEAARIGDARNGERCVREQAFREQQTMRLRELERRYTNFALECPTKMAFTHAHVVREIADAASVECAGGDAVGSDVRESRDCVDDRAPWGKFWTAA